MLILRTIISLLMLLVTIGPLWSMNEARLLTQSSSGQTAVFNLGIHDGIKEGDYAVIVKEIHDLDERELRLVPAAKARNIKINSDSSVWILYKIYDSEMMVKGDKFLILSESSMLNGRADPRLNRIKLVADSKKVNKTTKEALSNDRDRLSKLKNKYATISEAHEAEVRGADFDLIDVEKWEKSGNIRYRSALYKSPHAAEFRREVRLSTFEKLVTNYLRKVNDPDFNYDTFYAEQMRTEQNNEFRKKTNFATEYENFLHAQSQRATADAKIYRQILEKGEAWSGDYSDEDLGRILSEVSILQEKDRREVVMSKPNRYAVSLDYGTLLTDSQNKADSYRRSSNYSVELGFEAIPFLKHKTLERFTLDGSVRTNKTATESSGYNTNVDEISVALGANWYPLYAPYMVQSPVLFFGMFIRSGYATLTAPSANEDGKYTVLSMPGFRVGMKYILRNNLALRVVGSLETLKLDQYNTKYLDTVLPDSTNLVDGKFSFGLGYSF